MQYEVLLIEEPYKHSLHTWDCVWQEPYRHIVHLWDCVWQEPYRHMLHLWVCMCCSRKYVKFKYTRIEKRTEKCTLFTKTLFFLIECCINNLASGSVLRFVVYVCVHSFVVSVCVHSFVVSVCVHSFVLFVLCYTFYDMFFMFCGFSYCTVWFILIRHFVV